jgi:hypothetical protein
MPGELRWLLSLVALLFLLYPFFHLADLHFQVVQHQSVRQHQSLAPAEKWDTLYLDPSIWYDAKGLPREFNFQGKRYDLRKILVFTKNEIRILAEYDPYEELLMAQIVRLFDESDPSMPSYIKLKKKDWIKDTIFRIPVASKREFFCFGWKESFSNPCIIRWSPPPRKQFYPTS